MAGSDRSERDGGSGDDHRGWDIPANPIPFPPYPETTQRPG